VTLLVGIDVGTTHLKAGAFTPEGRQVALAAVPTPTRRTAEGGGEYDPAAIWAGVTECLRRVVEAAGEPIAAVGVASMAEAGALLDSKGEAVRPAIAWFDPRGSAQAERLAREPGRSEIFQRTGLLVMAKHGLSKLMWLAEHEPESLERATTWLSMAEYVAYRLSGVQASCPTLAARTLAYDLRRGAWSQELIEAAGISPSLFPEIRPEGAAWGRLSAGSAAESGLPAGIPVTVAGHDHPCAALAAGVAAPGQALDSTGTAEALLGVIERPLLNEEVLASQIGQGPLPAPGLYALQAGTAASGGSLEWFLSEFLPGSGYGEAMAIAASAGVGPSGLLYLPHLSGGGPPGIEPASRGAIVGLTRGTSRAQVAKAILEGTCLEFRRMLDAMEDLTGHRFDRVVVSGGQAKSDLWLQVKADVLGREIIALQAPEATLLGASVLAGVAAGSSPDAVAAAGQLQRDERTITPGEASSAYQEIYRAYGALAPALRPLYRDWPRV
jgi:xylulokinase